jgi:predicted phage terminase large subunit-like protein
VCQTWGVFYNEEDNNRPHLIMLNQLRDKLEFPELKKAALAQYNYWQPDVLIVEAKASGQPLIDELRRSGIMVNGFSPGKGQDKIARLNTVSDLVASGQIWLPETAWAQQFMEELVAFPSGEHDDCVDTATLCWSRVRSGGLLPLASDAKDMDDYLPARRGSFY